MTTDEGFNNTTSKRVLPLRVKRFVVIQEEMLYCVLTASDASTEVTGRRINREENSYIGN